MFACIDTDRLGMAQGRTAMVEAAVVVGMPRRQAGSTAPCFQTVVVCHNHSLNCRPSYHLYWLVLGTCHCDESSGCARTHQLSTLLAHN